MTADDRALLLDVCQRLGKLEDATAQLTRELRQARRRGAKRAGTVARKAAERVACTPTDLDRAMARQILREAGR